MLDKMTMRNKLLLILLLPLLGLLYFSVSAVIEKGQTSLQMSRTEQMMNLLVKLGNTAHELQKERGMTSGFLASKGQKFSSELPSQRKEADNQVSSLKQATLDFKDTSHEAVLDEKLDEMTRLLSALDAKRAAVSGLAISGTEAIDYYSKTIETMLSVSRQAMFLTGASRLTRLAAAYSSLTYAKEYTGIERALFAGVFSAGKFDQEKLTRFFANDAARKIYLHEFETTAFATQLQLYRQKVSGQAVDEVTRMKKTAAEGLDGRNLGINPEHWFTMATAQIDQFAEVDHKLASELLEETGTLKTRALLGLGFYLLMTLLGVTFTGLIARRTILSILRQLGGEPSYAVEIAGRIANGDLSMEIVTEPENTQSVIAAFKAMQSKMTDELAREVKVQEEVSQLVRAAAAGDLTRRVTLEDKQGFMKRLGEGINETLDAVVGPIGEASRTLERMAAKDLTARMEGEYKGDFIKIKNSLNQAVEHLDQSLQQVCLSAEQLTSASGQIGSGSQVLAQGASEQASSLEEISSSLQEMTSMTKQNTENASEAKSLSNAARKGADKGVENMKKLSSAVDKIKSSADDTAKIVKTINEIAFQTNLLALNAAVEAARAGDAGLGFAVVAQEVRNLAMRSAEAAKSTAGMIEVSVINAESGVALNQEAIRNFDEINSQVSKVSDMMAEIAAACQQQSQGIEEVNTAVQQMSQLTQQSAANSEESASAAEELAAQAQEMQTMVASFTVSGEAGRTRQLHQEKAEMKPHKMVAAGVARKNHSSVFPHCDEKKALSSF